MIILYESTETEFITNGLGVLSDATSCEVVEERNGQFEVEMDYPITGIHYSDIELRRILFCKPNPFDTPQPFRIYNITKPINGIVTITAAHISYDLNGIPIIPFKETNSSVSLAFSNIVSHKAVTGDKFTFYTDKSNTAMFGVSCPTNMRALLGGVEGSILDVFGTGEYKFDKFKVNFYLHRGQDRGVQIRYGKNLTDLKQEENCANLYTGVYAYWSGIQYNNDGTSKDILIETSPRIISVPGTFNFTNILILDCTSEFEEAPTSSQLNTKVNNYITENDIGKPKVSIDVSFLQLEQSNEYETIQLLERVYLCDTLSVYFPKLGVSSTAKCIKTVYDALTDKYKSLELGDAKSNLSSTIISMSEDSNNKIEDTSTFLEKAINEATNAIKRGLGGFVILRDSSGGTTPDELLIMNTPKVETATQVWRFNKNGWGYSSTGYNGPYRMAATMDGVFNADFIKAGTMMANRIKGGTLTLGGWNNENGILIINDAYGYQRGKFDNKGLEVSNNDRYIELKNGTIYIGIYEYGEKNEQGYIYADEEYSPYYGRYLKNIKIGVYNGGTISINEYGEMNLYANNSISINADNGIDLSSYYGEVRLVNPSTGQIISTSDEWKRLYLPTGGVSRDGCYAVTNLSINFGGGYANWSERWVITDVNLDVTDYTLLCHNY